MADNLEPHWTTQNDRLQKLLEKCDIPKTRVNDLKWLSQNLLVHNKNREAVEAHIIIHAKLKKDRYYGKF
jgi:hypothetical protein